MARLRRKPVSIYGSMSQSIFARPKSSSSFRTPRFSALSRTKWTFWHLKTACGTAFRAPMFIWGSPVAVSNGLRLWGWWKSRQEGLAVSIDKIDAPFLRPVVIRSLHITTAPAAAFHIDLTAAGANFDLNLNRILLYR